MCTVFAVVLAKNINYCNVARAHRYGIMPHFFWWFTKFHALHILYSIYIGFNSIIA